jgi:hypothetical protein
MKRIALFSLLLFLLACKKQNTIYIPLHNASLNWLMVTDNFFIDGAGDTLFFTSATTKTERYSNFADIAENSGFWDGEIRTQTTVIDSSITYSTQLRANLDSGYVRNDLVRLTFQYATTEITFTGGAHPTNTIDIDSTVFYLPLWNVNGRTYTNVYYKEIIGTDHVAVFVNAELNLVGFFINGKLYNQEE